MKKGQLFISLRDVPLRGIGDCLHHIGVIDCVDNDTAIIEFIRDCDGNVISQAYETKQYAFFNRKASKSLVSQLKPKTGHNARYFLLLPVGVSIEAAQEVVANYYNKPIKEHSKPSTSDYVIVCGTEHTIHTDCTLAQIRNQTALTASERNLSAKLYELTKIGEAVVEVKWSK